MDALDDVALLQIAVLQQDLLERDVQKVRKRKRRRPRRYQKLLGLHAAPRPAVDFVPFFLGGMP